MRKKITIVAATEGEIHPLKEHLEKEAVRLSPTHFQIADVEIEILITGIGILHATYSLMDYLMDHQPDAWIQAGIGGAFDRSLEIGNVYLIESEVLVDFGAQDANGKIINQFELGWTDPHEYPYVNEVLPCPFIPYDMNLPVASGMTTLYSHGFADKIDKIESGLHGQIESMEGAAFFYVSLMKKIPFLSLRAVSNYVEKRDKSKWEINKSIDKLNRQIIQIVGNAKFIL